MNFKPVFYTLFLALFLYGIDSAFAQNDDGNVEEYCGESFKKMQDLSEKNSIVRYLISNFPDSVFVKGITEESYPPWLHAEYQYTSDDEHLKLKLLHMPCRFDPIVLNFVYRDAKNDIYIDASPEHLSYLESVEEETILESLKDIVLHKTHQKWLNHNDKIVYVYPESINALITRGYITDNIQWMFENEEMQRLHCEARGGQMTSWSNISSKSSQCGLPTFDSGKSCEDSSQCESYCQAPEDAKPGDKAIGRCYYFQITSCMSEVNMRTVQPEWCR